jgi:hypothetical protein
MSTDATSQRGLERRSSSALPSIDDPRQTSCQLSVIHHSQHQCACLAHAPPQPDFDCARRATTARCALTKLLLLPHRFPPSTDAVGWQQQARRWAGMDGPCASSFCASVFASSGPSITPPFLRHFTNCTRGRSPNFCAHLAKEMMSDRRFKWGGNSTCRQVKTTVDQTGCQAVHLSCRLAQGTRRPLAMRGNTGDGMLRCRAPTPTPIAGVVYTNH